MRLLGWIAIQYNTMCVLIKRRNLDTAIDTCTETGRMACDNEGREWSDRCTGQGTLRTASSTSEAGREAWNILLHSPQKEPTLPTHCSWVATL